jgi:hypothetical protein
MVGVWELVQQGSVLILLGMKLASGMREQSGGGCKRWEC